MISEEARPVAGGRCRVRLGAFASFDTVHDAPRFAFVARVVEVESELEMAIFAEDEAGDRLERPTFVLVPQAVAVASQPIGLGLPLREAPRGGVLLHRGETLGPG